MARKTVNDTFNDIKTAIEGIKKRKIENLSKEQLEILKSSFDSLSNEYFKLIENFEERENKEMIEKLEKRGFKVEKRVD